MSQQLSLRELCGSKGPGLASPSPPIGQTQILLPLPSRCSLQVRVLAPGSCESFPQTCSVCEAEESDDEQAGVEREAVEHFLHEDGGSLSSGRRIRPELTSHLLSGIWAET